MEEPNLDDSLADFKSPKAENVAQPGSSRLKPKDNKVKKSSANVKKKSSRKKKEIVAQPSIESSFFKKTNTAKNVGHTCPICMKYFADTNAGAGHTKNCAAKNQVSPKKLLAAVALQERQAQERAAIGLPVGPVEQAKQKTLRRNHAPGLKGDSDLQLAMALSESLREIQMKKEFEEAMLLAAEHHGDNFVSALTESERRMTLQNFGFSTNKPIATGTTPNDLVKMTRPNHLGPKILQTRTEETRNRILSEKLMQILMQDAVITQVNQESCAADEKPVDGSSKLLAIRRLNVIYHSTPRMWNYAGLSESVTIFVIEAFRIISGPLTENKTTSPAICDPESDSSDEKCQDKNEIPFCILEDSFFQSGRRISEDPTNSTKNGTISLAGSIQESENSDKNNQDEKKILPCASKDNSSQSERKMLEEPLNSSKFGTISSPICITECDNSDEKEVVPCTSKNASSQPEHKISKETSNSTSYKIKKNNVSDCAVIDVPISSEINQKYINIVANDWAKLLNVSSMSDVVIIVKNNHIWAHKLVLHVRCPTMLQDCETNDNEKFSQAAEQILWPKTDFSIGLAFLEFVYSGAIIKNVHVFMNSQDVRGIHFLAIMYSMDDLVLYLRKRQVEIDDFIICEMKKSGQLSLLRNENNDTIQKDSYPHRTSELINDDRVSPKISPYKESVAIKKLNISSPKDNEELISNVAINSSRHSVSPDLFEDTDLSFKESEKSNAEENNEGNCKLTSEEISLIKLLANDNLLRLNSTASMLSTSKVSSSQMLIETPKSHRNSIGINVKEKSNEQSRSQQFIEKPRSNISLFIEKVQKINAKSIYDTISDDDEFQGKIPHNRTLRNPFRVNKNSESLISSPESQKKNKNSRNVEKNIETRTEINDDLSESTITEGLPGELDTSDSVMTSDYENMSMYSKYRKNHKHNNSISKYRKILNEVTEINSIFSDDDEKSNNSKLPNEKSFDLTQDSDTEKEICLSSSEHNNSISENRKDPNEIRDINADLSDDDEKSNNSRVLNEESIDFTQDSDTEKETQDSDVEKETSSSPLENSIGSPIWKQLTRDLEKVENSQPATAKNVRKSLNIREIEVSEIDEQLFADSWRYSKIVPDENTERLSSRSFPAADDLLSFRRKRKHDKEKISVINLDKNNDELESECEYPLSEDGKGFDDSFEYPVSQTFKVNDELSKKNSSPRKNSSNSSLSIEKKSVNSASFIDELERDEEDALRQYFDKSLENATSPTNCSDDSNPEIFKANENILTQSFINSRFSRNKHSNPEFNNSAAVEQNDDRINSNLLRTPTPIVISSSREYDLDFETCVVDKEQEFNKENSFAAERNNVNPKKSPTPEPRASTSRQEYSPACKINSKKRESNSRKHCNSIPTNKDDYEQFRKVNRTPSTSTKVVLLQNVTPPVNYDEMNTPELKRELEKYGIKPQKRNRARQLLTHIYNETHPLVPDSEVRSLTTDKIGTTVDDGEPPTKKIAKSKKQMSNDFESDLEISLSQDSVVSASSIIPEEMVFSDGDLSSDETFSDMSIKQAFQALMELDKTLHNEVLTYKPLQLEPVYSTLKARGLKCKFNDLMDFLDAECITFQVRRQSIQKKNNKAKGKKCGSSGTRKANTQKKKLL